MGRLLRAPVFLAGLIAVPLIAVPGQNRGSDGTPDTRLRRADRTTAAPRQVGTITGTVTVTRTNEPLDRGRPRSPVRSRV
jgi:hypothetical protein